MNKPPPQQNVQVTIVPRFEIRQQLLQAEGKLAQIRGELLELAGHLTKQLGHVELGEHMLRAAALGIVPPHVDERIIPRPEDLAELRAALAYVTKFAADIAAVTAAPVKSAS